MIDFDKAIELIITALFSGIGSALGMYFSNKALIKYVEKILKRMKHRVQA